MEKTMKMLRKRFSFVICIFLLCCVNEAFPGNGKFVVDSEGVGRFNFIVSLQFNATNAEINLVKQRFTQASSILYFATGGQHQFGNILICQNGMANDFADFYIYKSGVSCNIPECGSNEAKLCGYGVPNGEETPCQYNPGASTYASLNWDRICDSSRGQLTIVHEFAHLAYGLGDEYSNGGSTPNSRCVDPASVSGTQSACIMGNYYQTGGDSSDPNRFETISCFSHGSVLKTPTLVDFCDSSNHTSGSPQTNQQHTLYGKSCWEVILDKATDFPIAEPPPDTPDLPAPPNISVGVPERRVILIIDRSGSMSGARLAAVQTATENFIQNLPTSDFKLGVVSYADTARVDLNLADVSAATKQAAIDTINRIEAGGLTAIGEGLAQALSILPADTACLESFILLSDGIHNNDGTKPIEDVLPALVSRGAVVFSVGIGSDVNDELLTDIATQTGGKYFSSPGDLPSTPFLRLAPQQVTMSQQINPFVFELQNIFVELLRRVQEGAFFVNRFNRLEANQSLTIPVQVDMMTQQASFILNWQTASQGLEFSVLRPGGRRLAPDDPGVTFSSTLTSKGVNVLGAEPGKWQMLITNPSNDEQVTFRVHAISDAPNVGIWALPGSPMVTAPEPIFVGAQPFSSGLPVANATVSAIVTKPGVAERDTIALLDNGQSADENASDGVYSGKFSNYSQDGEYTIDIIAEVKDGAFITGNHLDSGPPTIFPEDYTRTTSLSVIVNGVTPEPDKQTLLAIDQNQGGRQELLQISFGESPIKVTHLGHIMSGDIELKGIAGMSWVPDSAGGNILIVSNNTQQNGLYRISKSDISDSVGSRRIPARKIGDLHNHMIDAIAVNPSNGLLFGIINEGENSTLVRIDTSSSDVHAVGQIGFSNIEGLVFTVESLPTLYGISNGQNNLVAIDTRTGHGAVIGSKIGFEDIECLAFLHHGKLVGFSNDDEKGRRFLELAPGRHGGRIIPTPDFSPRITGAAFLWPDMPVSPPKHKNVFSFTNRKTVTGPLRNQSIRVDRDMVADNSGTTQITFNLADRGRQHIKIRILDVFEREVAVVLDSLLESGNHMISWDGMREDGKPLPPGTYYYQIASPQETIIGQ